MRAPKIGVFASVWAILFIAMACGSGSNTESATANLSSKELQYFTNGKVLYERLCANCHNAEGTGLGRLIPPLKGSDYLLGDIPRAAKIIKFGQRGPVTVNGIEYNNPMPANPDLTNLEIVELITYITNSWGNEAKVPSIEDVASYLKED